MKETLIQDYLTNTRSNTGAFDFMVTSVTTIDFSRIHVRYSYSINPSISKVERETECSTIQIIDLVAFAYCN